MAIHPTKSRLLYLRRHLYECSDEEHPLTTKDLISFLEQQGFPTDRKTLKNDLDLLIQFGDDIIVQRSRPNKYYVGERIFQIPELKLMVDAVGASRFITEKKSRELIDKLTAMASEGQKKELTRHVYTMNRIKTGTEQIYYNVDAVYSAIEAGEQIEFHYTEYNGLKEKVLRGDGEVYTLSPYMLCWNDDQYYVVGWSEKHNSVSAFRVDRMVGTRANGEPAVPMPEGFNLEDYSSKIFEMYDGEEALVTLEAEDKQMKYLVDHFGEDFSTDKPRAGRFQAHVHVKLSPPFYSWVFQFGGDIRIIGPEEAVEGYTAHIRAALGSLPEKQREELEESFKGK